MNAKLPKKVSLSSVVYVTIATITIDYFCSTKIIKNINDF